MEKKLNTEKKLHEFTFNTERGLVIVHYKTNNPERIANNFKINLKLRYDHVELIEIK